MNGSAYARVGDCIGGLWRRGEKDGVQRNGEKSMSSLSPGGRVACNVLIQKVSRRFRCASLSSPLGLGGDHLKDHDFEVVNVGVSCR